MANNNGHNCSPLQEDGSEQVADPIPIFDFEKVYRIVRIGNFRNSKNDSAAQCLPHEETRLCKDAISFKHHDNCVVDSQLFKGPLS